LYKIFIYRETAATQKHSNASVTINKTKATTKSIISLFDTSHSPVKIKYKRLWITANGDLYWERAGARMAALLPGYGGR